MGSKTETQESKAVKQTVRGNKVKKEASVGGKVRKGFLLLAKIKQVPGETRSARGDRTQEE